METRRKVRVSDVVHRERRPIPAPDRELSALLPLSQERLPELIRDIGVNRGRQIRQRHASKFRFRVASQLARGAVCDDEARTVIRQQHRDRTVGDQFTQLRGARRSLLRQGTAEGSDGCGYWVTHVSVSCKDGRSITSPVGSVAGPADAAVAASEGSDPES